MKQQFFLFISLLLCAVYFTACTSESYNVDTVKAEDTSAANKKTTTNSIGAVSSIKGKTFAVKTPPFFVLSVGANYNIGISETSENFSPDQFEGGLNFGVKNGFGVSATGKFALDKKTGNLRLILHGAYNHFSSNTSGTFKYNILSFGPGLENSFTPRFSVKPFIGGALLGSMISGSADYTINGTETNITIKNSFRLGFMFYAGLEYALSDHVGVNIGAKITNANTWLKSTKDDQNGNEIGLRDAFSSPQLTYGGWKNFAYTSFFGGISFYFGVKNKLYKF